MNNPDIIGSQRVVCEQCGGRDFRLEDGYYYCSECQLQTQEYQEHVMDMEYGGAFARSKKIKDYDPEGLKSQSHQSQNGSESVRGSSSVSSWEILNYALKGLVDELILLGAPKSLKPITLQLWASYLSKTEIAFTSISVQAKPKFGIYHRRSDAKLFYKTTSSSVKQFPTLLRKRKKKCHSGGTSDRARKIRLGKDKKALAREIYNNESLASSSFAESQSSFNLSSLSTSLASLRSQPSSMLSKSERFSYSHKGKSDVNEFLADVADDEEIAVGFHKRYMKKAKESVHHATLLRVIAILRIALLISGSNIHLGDMRRWMDEGYLSLDCLQKFIPPSVHLSPGQVLLLSQVPFYKKVAEKTKEMVILLSVSDDSLSPTHLINALVKRYCIMLNLPDTICVGVERLLEMKPLEAPLCCPYLSNFEAKAMGFILFSLKVLIGLDDATEYVYMPRSDTEGVRWEEWCRQYVARMAEKAITHHPTLCRLYPNSFIGRDHSLLSHWDPSSGKSFPFKTNKGMDPEMKDSIHQILKTLVCQLPEPSWKPGLETETTRTGPQLAVLSESVYRATEIAHRQKSIILVRPYQDPQPKLNSSETIVVQLQDDEHVQEPSGSDLITLYPIDNIKKCKSKKNKKNSFRSSTLPDFNIWMYHSKNLLRVGNSRFDQIIQEKLPFSFVWLLGEMSNLICQPKNSIYRQLVTIEMSFKTQRRHKKTTSRYK